MIALHMMLEKAGHEADNQDLQDLPTLNSSTTNDAILHIAEILFSCIDIDDSNGVITQIRVIKFSPQRLFDVSKRL